MKEQERDQIPAAQSSTMGSAAVRTATGRGAATQALATAAAGANSKQAAATVFCSETSHLRYLHDVVRAFFLSKTLL